MPLVVTICLEEVYKVLIKIFNVNTKGNLSRILYHIMIKVRKAQAIINKTPLK